MRCFVSGGAGFIGSHLVDALLNRGDEVISADCFTPYYDVYAKVTNVEPQRTHPECTFVQADLRAADLDELLNGVDVVFHQAAQPGVRASWDEGFGDYATHNVLATQRLLEAARRQGVSRFVYASSSSVYGNALTHPTYEDALPAPFSPYGVTKLAGEHLCRAYANNFRFPTVSLRYFTVYGPRQRPDMSIHRLIRSALTQEPFPLFGDGTQVREFTFVGDIVRANLAAADVDAEPGLVCNVSGGGEISLRDLIELVGSLTGKDVRIKHSDAQPGDVRRNGGSIDRAGETLGWQPTIDLKTGILRQIEWHRSQIV